MTAIANEERLEKNKPLPKIINKTDMIIPMDAIKHEQSVKKENIEFNRSHARKKQ